jgi:hypothetical protein
MSQDDKNQLCFIKAEELGRKSNKHRGVRMSAPRRTSVLEEALQVARAIRRERERQDALLCVAKAQAKAGLAKEATDTLAQSLQVALSLKDVQYRATALSFVAEAQVEAGQINEAIDTLDQALQAAESIKGEDDTELLYVVSRLTSIAVTQAKAGLLKETAHVQPSARLPYELTWTRRGYMRSLRLLKHKRRQG